MENQRPILSIRLNTLVLIDVEYALLVWINF